MSEHTENKKEEVGYAWNFAADLGNGCQFSLSGNFPKGLSAETMNKEVDKVRSVFNRQQAKSAAQSAGDEVQTLLLRHGSALDDLIRLDNKGEQKGGLTAQERSNREAAVLHIDKLQKDIDFKKSFVQKLLEEAK